MANITNITLPDNSNYTLVDGTALHVTGTAAANNVPVYQADGTVTWGASGNTSKFFVITEDIVTAQNVNVKGTASPYNSTYGYKNITINSSDIEWIEGAAYCFVVDSEMVVGNSYRNVRVRIGSSGAWIPVMGAASTILPGSSYFLKSQTRIFIYKTTYQTAGALHLVSDNDTKVTQTASTTAGVKPVLLAADSTTSTDTASFDADVTINPGTGELNAVQYTIGGTTDGASTVVATKSETGGWVWA